MLKLVGDAKLHLAIPNPGSFSPNSLKGVIWGSSFLVDKVSHFIAGE